MKTTAIFLTLLFFFGNVSKTERVESKVYSFSDAKVEKTSSGEKRQMIDGETAHLEKFEIHTTMLNPGIKSHEPHTHAPAEIVIMMEGTTEMEIGSNIYPGKVGDIYFLGSNIPHAIRNTGDKPCMYLAFQWE